MQGKHGEVISQKDLDDLLDRSDLIEQYEKSKQKKGTVPLSSVSVFMAPV